MGYNSVIRKGELLFNSVEPVEVIVLNLKCGPRLLYWSECEVLCGVRAGSHVGRHDKIPNLLREKKDNITTTELSKD